MAEATESVVVATGPTDLATPGDLLRHAINENVDIEKLTQLMDLQVRWQKEQARNAYTKAMAAFKAESPATLAKDHTVDHPSKGGRVTYKHATLGAINKVVVPLLSKHGLRHNFEVIQPAANVVTVQCRITHVAGHSEVVELTAGHDHSGSKNAIQALGSAVAYLQRYSFVAALGLATADDDDDGRASGPPVDEPRRGQQRAPQRRPEGQPPSENPAPNSRPAAENGEAVMTKTAGKLLREIQAATTLEDCEPLDAKVDRLRDKESKLSLRTDLSRRRLGILREQARLADTDEELIPILERAFRFREEGKLTARMVSWLKAEIEKPQGVPGE